VSLRGHDPVLGKFTNRGNFIFDNDDTFHMTSSFDKGPHMFFTGNVNAPKNIIEGKWELPIDGNPSKILLEKKFGVPLTGINCIKGTFELRTPPGGYAEIKKNLVPEIPPRKRPSMQDSRGTRKVTLDSTEIQEPQDCDLPNPKHFPGSIIMTKKDGRGGDPGAPVNYGDDPSDICPGDNAPPKPSKLNHTRPAIPPRKIDGKIPNITPYNPGTTGSGPGKITYSNNSTPYKTIQANNPKTPGKVPSITPYTPATKEDPRKRLNPSNNSTPYGETTKLTLRTPIKGPRFLKTDTPDTANHIYKSPGRTPNSKTPGRTPNSGVKTPSNYNTKPSPRPGRRTQVNTSPFWQKPKSDSPEFFGKACCAFHPIAPRERLHEIQTVKDYKKSVLPVSFCLLRIILDKND
jgi:hypothetical protein